MDNGISGNVKVPFEFFAKAKADYGDWLWAFLREIIQNSYDAGCDNIRFTVKDTEQGVTVDAIDDGSGMDRNTLLNVMLCLGGSQKDSSQRVGGFGVAKQIILFAHPEYELWSRNSYVLGSGGDYKCMDLNNPVSGTRIKVLLGTSVNSAMVTEKLKLYVGHMYPERAIAIWLNGEPLEQDITGYDEEIETSIGGVYFIDTPTESVSRVMVTVRGLPMFNHTAYHDQDNFKATISLSGDYSWFTSNRDSLVYEHRLALNNLLQQLVTERNQLSLAARSVRLTVNRRQVLKYVPRDVTGEQSQQQVEDEPLLKKFATSFVEPIEGDTAGPQLLGKQFEEAQTTQERVMFKLYDAVDFTKYHADFELSLEDVAVRKGQGREELSARNVVQYLNKVRSAKLAGLWNEIVMYLVALPIVKDNMSYEVTTGFLFSSTQPVEGMCSKSEEGKARIYINPLSKLMQGDWWEDDVADLAVHEVAHLLIGEHNAKFTSMTDAIRAAYRRQLYADQQAEKAQRKTMLQGTIEN